MKLKIRMNGKTKPGMWPGAKVRVKTNHEDLLKEKRKYRYVAINSVEPGDFVVGPNGHFIVTPTGAMSNTMDKVEVRGICEDGQNIGKHFIADYTPFLINLTLVKKVKEEHAKSAASYEKWVLKRELKEEKWQEAREKRRKNEPVGKKLFKLHFKLKLRRN